MLEIDVTKQAQAYLNDNEPFPLTGNVMQLGEQAATITWSNALSANDKYEYVNDSNVQLISNYFNSMMGMELDERERLDKEVLNAIMIQHIDLELKEFGLDGELQDDGYTPFFRHEDSIYIQIDAWM